MEDYKKLQLYKKGLELTEEKLRLEEDFLTRNGKYSTIGSPELIGKLKDSIVWDKENIALLEYSIRNSLREKYKNIETLDRLLVINDKGVFWLYKVEDGKKGDIDECLGRNDDKLTLDILPEELHEMTPNDIVKVKVVKEIGSYKRRKITKQVFIDADF